MAKAAKYIIALGLALACVSALAGMAGARRYGSVAYEASAIAALLNWAAGSMSLACIFLCRRTVQRAQSVLLAMAVRMALPLAALAFLARWQHPLVSGGLGGMIVIHYLAGLVLETIMGVRLVAAMGGGDRSARDAAAVQSPAGMGV
ncbi:MAG TPA: hypothetical protein VEQ85_05955 [Lacipirellulaceae bacterium]|nr:hypothetical protein [Lacipirellulaceae bacterium]